MLGFDSPLGQETSNCSGPALNSVNGETYTQENGGRLKSGPSANGCMNECIVRRNIENKQKEWLMPPNL